MKKFLSVLLALLMLLSLSAGALAAEGDKADAAPGAEDTSAEAETEAAPTSAIVLTDAGEDPAQELAEGYELTYFAGGAKTADGIGGFMFTADSNNVNLLYSELSDDTGAFYTIGGAAANLTAEDTGAPVTALAADWVARYSAGYDSAVVLLADSDADCEPVISAKGYTYLTILNTLIYAEGSSRSALYSDVVGGTTVAGPGAGGGGTGGSETPVVVIAGSLLETTGTDSVSGAISVGDSGGRARGIQPQGKSVTYMYNSAIVSHTWGAWSTDSARQALDLIAYQSLGYSQNGYGAYADTSCRLFMYGSEVLGSSDGIVASNDGEIYAVSSACETGTTELRALMARTSSTRDLSWADYFDQSYAAADVTESAIGGGNTAVQFHMPDQGGSGARNTKKATLYMQGGTLFTDESLLSGENTAYTARYAGACLVTKSTQANILLEGVTLQSYSGELFHSMINSDTNVNNIADGDEAPGTDITLRSMDARGDIVNDDYQRAVRLTLDAATLTGAIYSNTWADWNAFCEAEGLSGYILNPDGYETVWGVELTLENGAVWNVTETSVITALTVGEDCVVNGTVTDNGDGTLTVAPLEGADYGGAEDISVSLNGADLGTLGTGEDGAYNLDVGALLGMLGIGLDYNEETGDLTITDNFGLLQAMAAAEE